METTIRQLAARLYGQGEESVSAQQAMYDCLPTLPVEEAAAIIKQVRAQDKYQLLTFALQGAAAIRVNALRALFSPAELDEIRQAK